MRFYCPGCWKDFAEDVAQCPHCSLKIHDFWDSKDWVEKIILALDHPEASTPIRAAWLLGKKKVGRAVGPLLALIEKTKDVYVLKAAIKALGDIGTLEAREGLKGLRNHPRRLIREEVFEILKVLDGKSRVCIPDESAQGELHEN